MTNLLLQFISEALLCDKHPHGDFRTYYYINVKNPPPIDDILETWVVNNAQIYDSCVNQDTPVMYPTTDLTKYREYTPSELRDGPGTERYEMLKNSIAKSGIKEPIILALGRNGVVKIGEGNHRHQIALDLGLKMIPVRFIFQREVHKTDIAKLRRDAEANDKMHAEKMAWLASAPKKVTQTTPEDEKDLDDLMAALGF